MPSKRVAELAQATIARCIIAREAACAPFERDIAARMESRSASWWRRFGLKADRESVVDSFDFVWHLGFSYASMTCRDAERAAKRLLLASAEAEEVWVSTADLWAVSP